MKSTLAPELKPQQEMIEMNNQFHISNGMCFDYNLPHDISDHHSRLSLEEQPNKFWRVDHIIRNSSDSSSNNLSTTRTEDNTSKIVVVDVLENDYHSKLVETIGISEIQSEYNKMNQDICFQLKGILNGNETDDIENLLNKHQFKNIADEYPTEYRNCQRLLMRSKQLAHVLWERIKPHFTKTDLKNMRPYGFDNNGTWVPIGLNDCFRVTKYEKGDYFKPHMDGQFIKNDNEKSILTVLIYLSFHGGEGGETKFFKLLSKERTRLTLQEVVSVTPVAHDCLIFNHDLYHSGETVISGRKYILRTEIMFKRVDAESILKSNYEQSEEYQQAKKLVDESNMLEKQGKVKEATEKYLESQEMQVKHSTKLFMERKNRKMSEIEKILPEEIFVTIFSYLTPLEICRTVIPLNTSINCYARSQILWKNNYFITWKSHDRESINTDNKDNPFRHLGALSSVEKSIIVEELKSKKKNYAAKEGANFDTIDWYNCFMTRKNFENDFCAILFDPGTSLIKYGLMSDSNFTIEKTICVKPFHVHFNISGRGLDDIVVGWHDCYNYNFCRPLPLITSSGGVQHQTVSYLIHQTIQQAFGKDSIRKHPLLIATPYFWSKDDEIKITDILFDIGIPAICMVPYYELLFLYYQMENCLIVDMSRSGLYCFAMYNGKIVKNCENGVLFEEDPNDKNKALHDAGKNMLNVLQILPVDQNSHLWQELASQVEDVYSYGKEVDGESRCVLGENLYTFVIHLVLSALDSCPQECQVDMKNKLLQNIIVRGGLSLVNGLIPRLENDLKKQFGTYCDKINISLKYDPLDTMGGAKIYANLSSFKEKCIFNV